MGAGTPLSKRQWQMVQLLEELVGDDYENFSLVPSALGRTASKLEDQDAALGALHRTLLATERDLPRYMRGLGAAHGDAFSTNLLDPEDDEPLDHGNANSTDGRRSYGWITGKLRGKKLIAAKEIEADRITMPPPPSFDPLPYMDKHTAHVFEHPLEHRMAEPREPAPARSCVMASRRNKLELYRTLARTGRLGILEPHECSSGISSGLFSVIKDLERDRLILDGRGANVYETPLHTWTKGLACADKVCQIYLPPGCELRASGRDLRDFFYQFVVSRERMVRNCLAGTLNKEELQYVFGDIPGLPSKARVGLSTLAMGDCSACEYAQCSHLGVLRAANVFSVEELISLATPVPRTPCMVGVIIDDLIVLEEVLATAGKAGDGSGGTHADERMQWADEAYSRAHLLSNPKKAFQNEPASKFWGIELDGVRGLVRPARSRLWPLIAVTIRVASLTFATRGLLKSLCGSWTSVLLVRRRMLSVVDLLFAAADGDDPNVVVKLSPSTSLIDELWVLVSLGALCVVDLRAEPADFIVATDASGWGGAAVRAYVPPHLVLEFCRHSLAKGTWTHLLPAGHAWLREKDLLKVEDELPGGVPLEPNELASTLATCLQCQERWRKGFRPNEHINCKELRAYLLEESYIAKAQSSVRLLSGLDSQVGLGALTKGRASSNALNNMLSASLGPYLSCGIYPHFMYFLSELNPGDAPTRGKDPPRPLRPLPAWWAPLVAGAQAPFDAWMRRQPGGPAAFDFGHLASTSESETALVADGLESMGAVAECELPLAPGREDNSIPCEDSAFGLRAKQFMFKGKRANFEERGALDLYAGSKGIAKALIELGAPWVATFELNDGPEQDLLDPTVRATVEAMIAGKKVRAVGLAPPCNSMSTAISPPVRTLQFPRGVPWLSGSMRKKVKDANSHAAWCVELIKLCQEHGVERWLEQPDSSWMWRFTGFKSYRRPAAPTLWRTDLCVFGTPWRKRTRLATSLRDLAGRRDFCRCRLPHVVLRGRSTEFRKSWTAVAQPYPKGFAASIGRAACRQVGWMPASGKFNIAACARCGHNRIGEASLPGPRKRIGPRLGSLEAHPLQTAVTLKYEEKLWEAFLNWCLSYLSDPCLVFSLCPVLAAMALRAYGNLCYSSGRTLSSFRHSIIAAQRRLLGVKPYLSLVWELVGRWEALEPPVHRCPVPEPIVKGLCYLAWMWQLRRWSGVTLLAFYGLARIGEVLKCRRRDLLLPADLLEDGLDCAFLNFSASKTSMRGHPKVQHTKIVVPAIVAWVSQVFYALGPDDLLWPGSPSSYRYRWDFLLRCLEVHKDLGLTPGGLRGGGAVQRYRAGASPVDIQWAMRLKHLGTLEHYLQELAAVTALTDVPPSGRNRIRTAAQLFDLKAGSLISS